MKALFKDKNFWIAVVLTFIFHGTGVLFLMSDLSNYGWALFVVLPIVLGIAIGALAKNSRPIWGSLFGTIAALILLYIPGLTGLLCVVMALPIIIPLILLGVWISRVIRRRRNMKSTDKVPVLLLPLLIFIVAAPVEQYLKVDKEAVMDVRTEQIFNYTPEQVYDAIKSVDTLVAEKPFLMYFDLPIPTKCVLEKEEIGGLRTCYFDPGRMSNADFGGGTIVEKITEFERGKVLKMDVIDYNLVGRHWLGFREAIYYFEKVGDSQCKMTRITTYTSVLAPRFYWEPLERLGIRQEHDFVFANLENDLRRLYGNQ